MSEWSGEIKTPVAIKAMPLLFPSWSHLWARLGAQHPPLLLPHPPLIPPSLLHLTPPLLSSHFLPPLPSPAQFSDSSPPLNLKLDSVPPRDSKPVFVSKPTTTRRRLERGSRRESGGGCQCPVCGKLFSRHWLLQGHLRTHTGEKPFGCPVCGKAFADKSNLRAHVQTHSGVKPFVCGRCGKAFALKSYLSKHCESTCA